MIIKGLFDLLLVLLNLVFGWVTLPPMPSVVDDAVVSLLTYINAGMGFVWLVVPRDFVLVMGPVVVVLSNFDRLYTVVMWILRKIPFFGIQ